MYTNADTRLQTNIKLIQTHQYITFNIQMVNKRPDTAEQSRKSKLWQLSLKSKQTQSSAQPTHTHKQSKQQRLTVSLQGLIWLLLRGEWKAKTSCLLRGTPLFHSLCHCPLLLPFFLRFHPPLPLFLRPPSSPPTAFPPSLLPTPSFPLGRALLYSAPPVSI